MPLIKNKFLIRDEYIHEFYNTYHAEHYDFGAKFPYTHTIRGDYTHNHNNTTHHLAPALSNVNKLAKHLELFIKGNHPAALIALLRADFIVEYNGQIREASFHTDQPAERQGHIYYYQVCTTQPNIEFLILKHNQTFRRLLAAAKEADLKNNHFLLHQKIVEQLHHLDLSDADLSKLDLCYADFSSSKLTKANFRESVLTNATFNTANLQGTIITKKQLTSCSYREAKLPIDFWPHWTTDTANKVLDSLHELRSYGKTLQRKEGIAAKLKGKEASDLANKLLSFMYRAQSYNESFQKKFLVDLHSKDHLFDQHRSYARIISNITLCILSGIVGYLIAGAINKKLTGNFTFFANTHTHNLIKNIDRSLPHKLSAMHTFMLGTHPRLGKQSTIRPFFGHNKKQPADAISDTNVLPIIQGFLY